MIDNNEISRRAKISNSLQLYFRTKEGIEHRKKLSEGQKKRMKEYNYYIKNIDKYGNGNCN